MNLIHICAMCALNVSMLKRTYIMEIVDSRKISIIFSTRIQEYFVSIGALYIRVAQKTANRFH